MEEGKNLTDLNLNDQQKALITYLLMPRKLKDIQAKFLWGYDKTWKSIRDLEAWGVIRKEKSRYGVFFQTTESVKV